MLSKWGISSTYPLAKVISAAMNPVLGARDQNRTNVVSQTLCDDVIKRLEPSLKPHTNCDIIDVYPGAGLLSSKFHDLLKPRRHILLEPNMKDYHSFINPLLEKPNSRYIHLPWDPVDLEIYDNLFDQGHLPEQTNRDLGPLGSCQSNNTLLVLANLTYHRQFGTRGYLFLRYMEACLEQTLFHRYGLVRVIAMLPAEDAETINPKILAKRKKAAALTEAVSDRLIEVSTDTSITRWCSMKGYKTLKKSAEQAAAQAAKKTIETPPGREPCPLKLAPDVTRHGRKTKSLDRPRHEWHHEYIILEEKFRKKEIERPPKNMPMAVIAQAPQYAGYKRLVELRRRMLSENRDMAAIDQMEEEQEVIDLKEEELLRDLKKPTRNPNNVVRRAEHIQGLVRQRDELLDSVRPRVREVFLWTRDERRCFQGKLPNGKQPLLFWDRRPYEPLHIDPEEVYPQKSCSIIDFHPNKNSPMMMTQREHIRNDTPDTYFAIVRTFQQLLGTYTTFALKPLQDILTLLFPSRSMSDLIDAVPSLEPYARPKILDLTKSTSRMPLLSLTGDEKTIQPDLLEYEEDCFSETLLRVIPTSVLWDLAVAWEAWSDRPHSQRDMQKALGGGKLMHLEGTSF
ncbi:hypothetical protein AJ80_02082 [Polytolypa hystricis UAMH7299]|uniref:rRNA adenine N(6)-methyltransferase n=1 Tax=Polytolypa hystricis (strain UAMH7299) TaxID=1447883 RepID=A0A2B7YIC7_POLH7|nr:hypothetical protein AJ80_02082 [Polytolypa hystricis UAMH7299]